VIFIRTIFGIGTVRALGAVRLNGFALVGSGI